MNGQDGAHVDEWTRPHQPESAFTGVHQWFQANADADPAAPALILPANEDEESILTYGDLESRANRLAQRLVRTGVTRGDLVALCLDRTEQLPIAMLAIWKAGAAYVPMDPEFPEARLRYMIEDARPRIVVTTSSIENRLALPGISVCLLDDEVDDSSQEAGVLPPLPASASSEDLAYVIYTSGSTGNPKGVEISHAAVLNFLSSMAAHPGFEADDRLLAITTCSFDIAVLELFLPLCAGGSFVLARREDVVDGRRLASLIESYSVTVMQATPSTWQLMFESGWSGSQHLRVLCGGEAMPEPLAERLAKTCGRLFNMYGPTETTVWSTVAELRPGDPIHIGRPIANTSVVLLDDRNRPVPPGAVGEICIGGSGLARGYLNRPELTGERFVRLPDSAGEGRLYRTGDNGRIRPDGRLECLGRVDTQIKIRGYRIEPGEIEAALERIGRVDRAVVKSWDSGPAQQLVAYLQSSSEVDVGALRTELRSALPEYMVPRAFVIRARMPLTPNGKVDRSKLPPPTPSDLTSAETDVRPRDEAEAAIEDIWCQHLGVERVGIHTQFFDVGGNSLLALRVLAEINTAFSTQISTIDFFDQPTVAELARTVSGGANHGSPDAVTDRLPTSPAHVDATQTGPEETPSRLTHSGQEADPASDASLPQADIGRVRELLASQGAATPSGRIGRSSTTRLRMRSSKLAKHLLAPLFSIERRLSRRFIQWMILKLEGGEMYSLTLRDLWRDHFDIEIGDFTDGGFDLVAIKRGTSIGRYCTITETSRIETANHPANTFSSNAVFYRPELGFSRGLEVPRSRVEIGNDVFIGHNATILHPTSKIGDGAIIAAHAVVTSDVPPFAVVAGYPAQILRYRFSRERIEELQALRWWDASLEDLAPASEEFIRPIEGRTVR